MKNKNLYLYICLSIIGIFTLGYFITLNKVSYAFSTDYVLEEYNSKVLFIQKAAENYAKKNENLFADNKTIYITVNDLVENNLLVADEDNNVKDPRSNVKTLNDNKIRITKKDNSFSVKLLEK